MFSKEDLIHVYTRKQAIKDGVLIDVTEIAAEVGHRLPVAITGAVYAKYVVSRYMSAKEPVRWQLLGLLTHVFLALLAPKEWGDGEVFRWRTQLPDDESSAREFEVRIVKGPDDDGNPCITVMLPHED